MEEGLERGMTSLSDVYEGDVGRVASRRQQLVGSGLFLAGVSCLVAAIALATTTVGTTVGLDGYAAREVAGITAGLGLPAVVLGVFSVLPAGRRTRATAAVGAGVAVGGVALFRQLYPYSWTSNAPLLALAAGIVYFGGIVTTFWCLFAALATVKTRKTPGGTARMEVTEEGTIRLVEEARSLPGLGGIGFLGQDPDGGVETQTNRRSADEPSGAVGDGGNDSQGGTLLDSGDTVTTATTDGPDGTATPSSGQRSVDRSPGPESREQSTPRGPSERSLDPDIASAGPESSPTTDGGTAATNTDPITETAVHHGEPDTYCGNCRHFQYVMHEDDIEPYCSYHEELMDDMDACPAWVDHE